MSVLTKLSADAYDPDAFQSFSAQPGFRLGTAKAMMWLSQLAYETDEPDKVATILSRWGTAALEDGIVSAVATSPLPIARTEAIVVRGHGAVFLAFAGTDPLVLADWVADFDIRSHHGGTTAGFALALEPVLPRLQRLLAAVEAPVIVTGHSLGGALAVLAAASLAGSGVPVTSVYTFGMPRPGGEPFRAQYEPLLGDATFRLVHGDDIVPTVAPSDLGFRHVGRLLRSAPGQSFDAARLAAAGSDEPGFASALGRTLLDGLLTPFKHWPMPGGGAGQDAGLPSWSGRPDAVRLLIQLLPRRIQEHLPESYLTALD